LEKSLSDKYGKDRVEIIQWAFSGASMFHYYCFVCKAEQYSPDLIVIPINFRTFGSHWVKGLRTGRKKDQLLYNELLVFAPLRERFSDDVYSINDLQGFTIFDRISLEANFWEAYYLLGFKLWAKDTLCLLFFNSSPELDRINRENMAKQEATEAWAESFENAERSEEFFESLYPMELPSDNMQLRLYATLVDALYRRQIPFMFYVSPINTQEMNGSGVFDDVKFDKIIEQMKEIAVSKGGIFLDVSRLLSDEQFGLLEHYTPEGARIVAQSIQPEIEQILQLPGRNTLSQESPSREKSHR
jgi:hypothetical protein